eukprot:TRINITY_DN5371_c0_g1_i1.p2 TRINITY_DN5371_c0_g1~~TRINITY_DN5371_c0_g1_i1.p2  ORF type:complete len:191 (-),score=78.31 TRINITY_DN5371_c0_g1_i1:500-1072(-)
MRLLTRKQQWRKTRTYKHEWQQLHPEQVASMVGAGQAPVKGWRWPWQSEEMDAAAADAQSRPQRLRRLLREQQQQQQQLQQQQAQQQQQQQQQQQERATAPRRTISGDLTVATPRRLFPGRGFDSPVDAASRLNSSGSLASSLGAGGQSPADGAPCESRDARPRVRFHCQVRVVMIPDRHSHLTTFQTST